MAENLFTLQTVKFNVFGPNLYWIGVVLNMQ